MVVSCIYITKKTENGTWHLLILWHFFLSVFLKCHRIWAAVSYETLMRG